jgi:hypothetical protein
MSVPSQGDPRFWSRVDASGDCWIWLGFRSTKGGYGELTIARRRVRAHRFAYEEVVGPIAPGLEIDHLCCNTACVNPDHLEPVTREENLRRRGQRRTHCASGHEYTPENTIIRTDSGRKCRVCRRAVVRAYKARRRSRLLAAAVAA